MKASHGTKSAFNQGVRPVLRAAFTALMAVSIAALHANIATAQLLSVKSYNLTISGTSSLHDWQSKAEKIECNASIILADDVLSDIKDVIVKIPVKSIKSSKGKVMDNKTWEAFHYDKHPFISFLMTARHMDPSTNAITVTGELSMAGITRRIDIIARYKMLQDGNFQVSGSKQLRMSDFDMEPPTAMMGTIKVGDQITIAFELVLTQNQSL